MSSMLSGAVKLAAWTLVGAVAVSTFVTAPGGVDSLGTLRSFLPGSVGGSGGAISVPAAPPSAAPAPQAPSPNALDLGGSVELAPGPDGNFHTSAEIDGLDVPMMVDTGASMVVLSYEQADRLGFRPLPSDFRYVSQTANGRTYFATITLPYVRLGGIEVDNVAAAVGMRGAIGAEGLLGMTFLSRLRSYQVDDGRLTLKN